MPDTIRRSLEEAAFMCNEDSIESVRFRDSDGAAEARVAFDRCLSPVQTRALRESDMWELKSCHVRDGTVHGWVVEQLEEPRDRPVVDESAAGGD